LSVCKKEEGTPLVLRNKPVQADVIHAFRSANKNNEEGLMKKRKEGKKRIRKGGREGGEY
jgi:hypothetical protein